MERKYLYSNWGYKLVNLALPSGNYGATENLVLKQVMIIIIIIYIFGEKH